MTELEKIRRAKQYIDKLANGVNPVDNSPVRDQDVINQVQVTRCLFFVSQVLGQVIEQREIRSSGRSVKQAFAITAEQRARIQFSQQPIAVSEFVRRVNEAVADQSDRQKLKTSDVTTWLLEQELLEIVPLADHKSTKIPTTRGREMGITLEQRIGPNGPYQVMLYDFGAQNFLVDCLEGIAAVSARISYTQTTPWTQEEEARLSELYRSGAAIEQIAFTLQRSASAVRARLKRLALVQ